MKRKNKKTISKCRLLKFLPGMQSVKVAGRVNPDQIPNSAVSGLGCIFCAQSCLSKYVG